MGKPLGILALNWESLVQRENVHILQMGKWRRQWEASHICPPGYRGAAINYTNELLFGFFTICLFPQLLHPSPHHSHACLFSGNLKGRKEEAFPDPRPAHPPTAPRSPPTQHSGMLTPPSGHMEHCACPKLTWCLGP